MPATRTKPAGKRLYSNGGNCVINGFHAMKFQGAKQDCEPCALRAQCLRTPEKAATRQVAFFLGKAPGHESQGDRMKAKIDSDTGRRISRAASPRRAGVRQPARQQGTESLHPPMAKPGFSKSSLGLTMNRRLLIAAALATLTAGVHIFVGTAEIAGPLLDSALAPELSFLLYACWHLVSSALAFSAVALFISALPAHRQSAYQMALFVSCLWLSFGLVFVAVGVLGADGTLLFKLPQWTLLLPVGALGLWGCASLRAAEANAVSSPGKRLS